MTAPHITENSMDEVTDAVSAIADAVSAVYSEMDAAGYGWVAWVLVYAAALTLGVRHVRWHMQRSQVSIAGQVVGMTSGTDRWGASLFRSAESVRRRPSLSPLYGKPAIWRGVPYPLAATALWLWVEHRVWFWLAASASGAYAARRVHRWASGFQHRRELVRPLARALAPLYGQDPEAILEGIVVPRDYMEPGRQVVVPLPDHHQPGLPAEVSRVVHDRLQGEWRVQKSQAAPYVLTFSHKPAPPSRVLPEDVAEIMLNGPLWEPFIGLGSEAEPVHLNFDGKVVHLGISAGTGAGKSTLMRILATQFAVRSGGTAHMAYLDVKGDDEGMESIPGMRVFNDIGDLHQLDGIFRMWKVIRWYVEEMDARRSGKRGPKEAWEPLVLFNDEQNAFAEFSRQAWDMVREKEDPKIPPVWNDLYLLAVMGRSFKIRLINAYQVMSADASGGGNAKRGAEIRRQFGYKMLARFDPSMWDNLVGTRPRGQSSDIPGRWLCVDNSGHARAVQLPYFEPEHAAQLCAAAGLDASVPTIGGRSSTAVPEPATATSHEIPAAFGDVRDGDGAREAVVLQFPRQQSQPSPWQMAEKAARELPPASEERRYTLKEACEAGIIPLDCETAKKQRTRARQRGEWYPPAERRGNAETYLEKDLRKFYGADSSPEGQAQ